MTDCTSIKAGDDVYLWHSGFNSSVGIVRVDRLTATQIVIGDRKFRRTTGRLIGQSVWSGIFVEPINEETKKAADEVIEERRINILRNKIRDIHWRDIPKEKVKAVAAIVLDQEKEVKR